MKINHHVKNMQLQGNGGRWPKLQLAMAGAAPPPKIKQRVPTYIDAMQI